MLQGRLCSLNVIHTVLLIRYSGEKAKLPLLLNTDFEKDFTMPQIVEKQVWSVPTAFSLKCFSLPPPLFP
jgi:hypothetical protein